MTKPQNLEYVTEEFTLNASVADDGTFTVNYPTGYIRGDFENSGLHYIRLNGAKLEQGKDITLSFGAGAVTVTNVTGAALAAGTGFMTMVRSSAPAAGIFALAKTATTGVTKKVRVAVDTLGLYRVNFGSPATADADGFCASQSVAAGADAVLDGALVTSGVGETAAPTGRNVAASWTGTAVITVNGLDMYGQPMQEKSGSGTSLTGKKAFKKITSVSFSAAVTAATVGEGVLLGYPVRLQRTSDILQQFEDDAKVGDFQSLSGTSVAGLANNTEGTATTADVRGTWSPNSTPDGAVSFEAWITVDDPTDIGNPQFAG